MKTSGFHSRTVSVGKAIFAVILLSALAAVEVQSAGITNVSPASVPISAPVSVRISTNYYVFGGTNHAQMRAAMAEARPWKQTMIYDANTRWDIHSTYRYSRSDGEFRLSGLHVTTTVLITLPRWIPGKPVSRELAASWLKCFTGLSVHEQGHLQLALAAGAEVKRRLENLASFPSSEELTAAADSTLKETIAEYQKREDKYDEVTGHGRTQGAVFPVEVRSGEDELIASSASTNRVPRRPSTRRP